jgi:hypothetical protein
VLQHQCLLRGKLHHRGRVVVVRDRRDLARHLPGPGQVGVGDEHGGRMEQQHQPAGASTQELLACGHIRAWMWPLLTTPATCRVTRRRTLNNPRSWSLDMPASAAARRTLPRLGL